MASKLWLALSRKKRDDVDGKESQLARVLTLLDLTALGVGATLGLGVYVLAGSVAKTTAGPAVCLSFLVAAIASAVAAMCYAEFASRVPKAGSAYVYSYVSVGEFIAFTIGWNLILEYVIGTASVARGLTNYFDRLIDNKIRDTLTSAMPINVSFLSPYPDFVSFGFVMLLTILLSIGVKESTRLNNIFTLLNLTTVTIVIIAGSINADPKNWTIPKEQVPENAGEGGFLPYGSAGIMAGAARCFFGFVGFDSIATTGEEAKNPQRDIPLAIIFSLIVIFFAYFGISTVITMALPYYAQDADAPLPHVFDLLGWHAIKWIVTIGAVVALCTSLLGAMFPLPRILYAMADDGVLFTFLAKIHPRFKTPLIATILSGLFAGSMAAIFDLDQLIDMMSIGTLLAYTIVGVCVLILRYEPTEESNKYQSTIEVPTGQNPFFKVFKDLFNLNMNKYPNESTSAITKWAISLYALLAAVMCAMFIYAFDMIKPDRPQFYVFIAILAAMFVTLIILVRQPTANTKLSFKVPLVPFIPCISIVINFYLMLELDQQTWIRFSVWLIIGYLIYCFYGIRNSREGITQKELELSEKKEKEKSSSTSTSKEITKI